MSACRSNGESARKMGDDGGGGGGGGRACVRACLLIECHHSLPDEFVNVNRSHAVRFAGRGAKCDGDKQPTRGGECQGDLNI